MLSRERPVLGSYACLEKQNFSWVLHLTLSGLFVCVFPPRLSLNGLDSSFGTYLKSFKNKLPAAQSVELSDRDQGIKFSVLPRFCWFVVRTCCHLISEHVQNRFLQKLRPVEMLSSFTHFSWRGLKQINIQWLILLQVHMSCLEGQKWKEQVPSPGVYQHLFLTATWAPSRC